MSSPEAVFKIIENNNCPLYKIDDKFTLSGQAILLKKKENTFITTSVIKIPEDKSACRILVEDLTAVLIKYENMNSVNRCVINCSGCSGLIRLEYKKEKPAPAAVNLRKREKNDIGTLVSLLYIFPIFQTLDEHDIEKIVPLLKMKKFPKDAIILKKGDPGSNLYIIISGKIDVLVDDDMSIGFLERGEVFGEISLLIGTPIGATIKVIEPARVLFITGRDFRNVLDMFPSLQIYFARLLAKRLSKTNDERFREITSGMIGNLSEMSPSELFQTLNLNRKTGVLNLSLSKGTSKLVFNEGNLIRAQYAKKEGKEAFFAILREKKGRFKFIQELSPEDVNTPEIGDFMWLLMEGTRRIDEDDTN